MADEISRRRAQSAPPSLEPEESAEGLIRPRAQSAPVETTPYNTDFAPAHTESFPSLDDILSSTINTPWQSVTDDLKALSEHTASFATLSNQDRHKLHAATERLFRNRNFLSKFRDWIGWFGPSDAAKARGKIIRSLNVHTDIHQRLGIDKLDDKTSEALAHLFELDPSAMDAFSAFATNKSVDKTTIMKLYNQVFASIVNQASDLTANEQNHGDQNPVQRLLLLTNHILDRMIFRNHQFHTDGIVSVFPDIIAAESPADRQRKNEIRSLTEATTPALAARIEAARRFGETSVRPDKGKLSEVVWSSPYNDKQDYSLLTHAGWDMVRDIPFQARRTLGLNIGDKTAMRAVTLKFPGDKQATPEQARAFVRLVDKVCREKGSNPDLKIDVDWAMTQVESRKLLQEDALAGLNHQALVQAASCFADECTQAIDDMHREVSLP